MNVLLWRYDARYRSATDIQLIGMLAVAAARSAGISQDRFYAELVLLAERQDMLVEHGYGRFGLF